MYLYILALLLLFLISFKLNEKFNLKINAPMQSPDKTNTSMNIKTLNQNSDPCFLYENTNRHQVLYGKLTNIFDKLSKGKKYNLKGELNEYVQGTWDDSIILELDEILKQILIKINKKSGFAFKKTSYDIIGEIKENINKQFKFNVFIQDPNEELTIRVYIDVVKIACDDEINKDNIKTCTQITTPEFPTYEIGIPKTDQYLPLPTEVITTPGFDTLSTKGINFRKGKPIKYLFLNEIKIYNTNAVINADGKCLGKSECGNYGVNLDHSLFNGPSTPFQEPACVRNKWPTLLDQPKCGLEWNCNLKSESWDKFGVRCPDEIVSEDCLGTQSSTTPIPNRPEYWPTHVTIPRNSGPNYWLFNLTRGDPSIDGADFSSA